MIHEIRRYSGATVYTQWGRIMVSCVRRSALWPRSVRVPTWFNIACVVPVTMNFGMDHLKLDNQRAITLKSGLATCASRCLDLQIGSGFVCSLTSEHLSMHARFVSESKTV